MFEDYIGKSETITGVLTQETLTKYRAIFGETHASLLHFALAQPTAAMEALGEDGHPQKGDFLPAIPLPRRMWAGGKLAFFHALTPEKPFIKTTTILNLTRKEGKTGELYFATLEHVFTQNGHVAIQETQDIVYKGDGLPLIKPIEPAPQGRFTKVIDVTTPLLFRYSALTFNAHRIHYDRDYAREIEGYPALVVHGPLQATWLMNFACELLGQSPAYFRFKSVSPLFDTDKITLHAAFEGEILQLWTARDGGGYAMQAQVRAHHALD